MHPLQTQPKYKKGTKRYARTKHGPIHLYIHSHILNVLLHCTWIYAYTEVHVPIIADKELYQSYLTSTDENKVNFNNKSY